MFLTKIGRNEMVAIIASHMMLDELSVKISHPYRRWIWVCLPFFFISCQVSSRIAMEGEGGRISYNTAIQHTNAQQMLLNLIRLRYSDSLTFLDVGSITTQSTISSQLSPVFTFPGFDRILFK